MSIRCDCDECGKDINGEDTICRSCFEKKVDEIESLEEEISELTDNISDLQEKVAELEAELEEHNQKG